MASKADWRQTKASAGGEVEKLGPGDIGSSVKGFSVELSCDPAFLLLRIDPRESGT